jgi:hypothetical protein
LREGARPLSGGKPIDARRGYAYPANVGEAAGAARGPERVTLNTEIKPIKSSNEPLAWTKTMAKSRIGLDHRHRDKSGRIERKLGNTRVAVLRKEYGPGFAKGYRSDTKLSTVLESTGSRSLHDYLKHSNSGKDDISKTILSRTTEVFEPALKNLAKK